MFQLLQGNGHAVLWPIVRPDQVETSAKARRTGLPAEERNGSLSYCALAG